MSELTFIALDAYSTPSRTAIPRHAEQLSGGSVEAVSGR